MNEPANPHDEVATKIGTAIAQDLWRLLPEIASALGPRGVPGVTFDAKVIFRNDPTMGVQVYVSTTHDYPDDGTPPIQLGWLGEQLGVVSVPAPAPVAPPQPQAPTAGYGAPETQHLIQPGQPGYVPAPGQPGYQVPRVPGAQPDIPMPRHPNEPLARQDPFPGARRPLADESGIA